MRTNKYVIIWNHANEKLQYSGKNILYTKIKNAKSNNNIMQVWLLTL